MHESLPGENYLLLLAVLLPPAALDALGPLVDERTVTTPFGDVGPLARRTHPAGARIWVQPYSGLPTRTDPRATLYAARELGVKRILNWDMGIALNPVLHRGQPVIASDYIDWSWRQPTTFSDSTQAPVGARQNRAPAFCEQMRAALRRAFPTAPDVVYIGVDGPRRETAAEARMFRTWGADVAGQNIVPEVALAHELDLCYAGLVTVADRSADQEAAPNVGDLRLGLEMTMQALPDFFVLLQGPSTCSC